MFPTHVPHTIIEAFDCAYELYKYMQPYQWAPCEAKTLKVSDLSDYRVTMYETIDLLFHMDLQFDDKQARSSVVYSMAPITTYSLFKNNDFIKVLGYVVFATYDNISRNFYCSTDPLDGSLRPLHEEYRLFIAANNVNRAHYYRRPFLLALQRTCYLWLLETCKRFELKGSVGFNVRWAEKNRKGTLYKLYTATVFMEFDLTKSYKFNETLTNSEIEIRLSLPTGFKKSEISTSRFEHDFAFYDELWDIRLKEITDRLVAQFPNMKCTDETIEDTE